MTAELEAIKTCYELQGMTVEQIAEDRELDPTSVKAALIQCSPNYRKLVKHEEDNENLEFTNDDLRAVNEVIKSIALGSEDDNLRLKAAIYIRDDKKGRKEVVKATQGMNFNVLQFNNVMQQVRGKADQMKQLVLSGKELSV